MGLSDCEIGRLSSELLEAERKLAPVDPLTDRYPHMTIPEAYAIELRTVRTKVESGRSVIGMKVGITSRAVREPLRVREVVHGHVLDDMAIGEDQPIPTRSLIQPRVEAGMGFLLKEDLRGPGVTTARALAATAGVIPAIEVVDSRIRDWRIKFQDAMAGNASAALVVMGVRIVSASRRGNSS